MLISKFRMAALAVAAVVVFPVSASAVVVDYSALSNAPHNLQNYDPIPQTFGDSPSVNFSYRTLNGGTNWGLSATEFSGQMLYWRDQNYSGDNAVFSDGTGLKSEVRIDSLVPGGVFTSITFDFGAFPDLDLLSDFRFYNGTTGNFLTIAVANVVSGVTGKQYTFNSIPNLTSVVAQWGDDWNVGLRSVTYELSEYNPNPVPLPAALPLLMTGLAGMGLIARRRRSRAS